MNWIMTARSAAGAKYPPSRIAAMAACAALIGLTSCERSALDQQMQDLCRNDGGVKVYETMTLPASYFDSAGRIKLGPLMPSGANGVESKSYFQSIGDDEYRYSWKREVVAGRADSNLEHGDGRLSRIREVVVRRADARLLGEYVWYDRGGGDGFTFGFQPSGNFCPKPRTDLIANVFMKGE